MLWGKKPKLLGLPSKTIYFCCLQCPNLMHFKKFFLFVCLTMHESKKLEGRLPWQKFIIWSRRMRHHLLFAMPTVLKWMPLLLQKWSMPITTGHKPLGILCRVSVKASKSEVMLELFSKFDLIHTATKPPSGSRFARPFMTTSGCSSLCGYTLMPTKAKGKRSVSFQ